MSANAFPKQYCGQVFVTNNYLMMLECKFCSEQFVPYEKFLNHIFDKHFDNIDEYKSDIEDDNDMGMLNAQHSDNDSTEQDIIDHTEFQTAEPEISTSNTTDKAHTSLAEANKQLDSNHHAEASNIRSVLKKNREVKKTGERKYKCKLCDDAFYTAATLRKHEQRHSDNKPFSCTECDKRFYTRIELTTHMRWHTGERPFVCTYCGRGFVSSSALNTHEKRHLNERKYKCEHCSKSYFTSVKLKQHLAVHTGERNYKCNYCADTFQRVGSLRNHMKLHENALRYECNICQRRFNQNSTLIWHKKSKHDIVTDECVETSDLSLMQQTNIISTAVENE